MGPRADGVVRGALPGFIAGAGRDRRCAVGHGHEMATCTHPRGSSGAGSSFVQGGWGLLQRGACIWLVELGRPHPCQNLEGSLDGGGGRAATHGPPDVLRAQKQRERPFGGRWEPLARIAADSSRYSLDCCRLSLLQPMRNGARGAARRSLGSPPRVVGRTIAIAIQSLFSAAAAAAGRCPRLARRGGFWAPPPNASWEGARAGLRRARAPGGCRGRRDALGRVSGTRGARLAVGGMEGRARGGDRRWALGRAGERSDIHGDVIHAANSGGEETTSGRYLLVRSLARPVLLHSTYRTSSPRSRSRQVGRRSCSIWKFL